MKTILLLIAFFLFLPFSSSAQWNPDGGLVLLSGLRHFTDWFVVPDDEGGFWLAYMLPNLEYRCYLQHYDSLGYSEYEGRGMQIVNRDVFQDVVVIAGAVSDGNGGINISFRNGNFDGDHPYGMYVQRINSNGEYVFGDEAFLSVPGRIFSPFLEPAVCSDRNGGIFQLYLANPGSIEPAVQYVTQSGDAQFEIDDPYIIDLEYTSLYKSYDGSCAFVVGYDASEGDPISCARINLNGEIVWRTEIDNPTGCVGLSNDISATHTQDDNIWVAWGTNEQPHIAKLDSNGEIIIPAFNMFPDYNQDQPHFTKIVCDDDGAAYMAVVENDDSDGQRINKVAPDGSLPWGGDGIDISTFEPSDMLGRPSEFIWDQDTQRIIISFRSGLYLPDEERWVTAQYIQALSPEGERIWNEEGILVMSIDMLDARGETVQLSDGSYLVLTSGYINEIRHLKAGKVYPDGTIALPSSAPEPPPTQLENQWEILSTYPNPFNSLVTINIRCGMDISRLKVYNISGQLVKEQLLNTTGNSHLKYNFEVSENIATGIYFIVLSSEDTTHDVAKILFLK